jgi:hypothetical protein
MRRSTWVRGEQPVATFVVPISAAATVGASMLDEPFTGDECLALIAKAEMGLAPDRPSHEADRAAVIGKDQAVVAAVLAQGRGGTRHRKLRRQLIEYAIPVLWFLLSTGEITVRFARMNDTFGAPPDVQELTQMGIKDQEELVLDMVSAGMKVFEKSVFDDKGWDPDKGAALTTYFVNACIRQLTPLFRHWRRLHRRDESYGIEPAAGSKTEAVGIAVGDSCYSDRTEHVLEAIDRADIQQVLLYVAQGYSRPEAARMSGLTPRAVREYFDRHRTRLWQAGQAPVIDSDDKPEGGQARG